MHACMPCETVVIIAKRVISSCNACVPNLASHTHLRGTHVHDCTCVPKPTHSMTAELEHFVAQFKTLSNGNSLEIAAINQWHADGDRESRDMIPFGISVWACMDCLSIDHTSEQEFQTSRTDCIWSHHARLKQTGKMKTKPPTH